MMPRSSVLVERLRCVDEIDPETRWVSGLNFTRAVIGERCTKSSRPDLSKEVIGAW